jgi:hypothetical protein
MPTPKKSEDKPTQTDPQKQTEKNAPDLSPSVADPPGPISPEHESGTEKTREDEEKARQAERQS